MPLTNPPDDSRIEADVRSVVALKSVPNILNVMCRTTGMGFAAVARVTAARWIACQVQDEVGFGIGPGDELEVEATLCAEVRNLREVVVIDHVATDPIYCDRLAPEKYGFQSYISVPIFLHNGAFFGTLCAFDPKPRQISSPHIVAMVRLFAELIGHHLDLEARSQESESALTQERLSADLREQFIAVLGHDLRNPLNSIAAGAALLRRRSVDPDTIRIVSRVEQSIGRMTHLVEDVMDFARGRLGGGLTVDARSETGLDIYLLHVIEELRAAYPDHDVEVSVSIPEPVTCDIGRLGQLLSNLLANAFTHGYPSAPVRINICQPPKELLIVVSNEGPPVPAPLLTNLFEPFFREDGKSNREGLGLGLYIAASIARAHGGALMATCEGEVVTFTFRMPNDR